MICPNCGRELPDTARVCTGCAAVQRVSRRRQVDVDLPETQQARVERRVQPACTPGSGFVVEKNLVDGITQRVELQQELEAPVEQGQIIGRVVVEAGGTQLGEYPVTAAAAVERMTWGRALGLLWRQLCSMN